MKKFAFIQIVAVSALVALTAILLSPVVMRTSGSEVSANENSVAVIELTDESGALKVGEELVYNVSYSIFDLGSVRIVVMDTVTKNGRLTYKAKAFVDSYSGVPFVDLHQVFYSEFTSDPYSVFYSIHNTADPAQIPFTEYDFDYVKNEVTYDVGIKPQRKITNHGVEKIKGFQQDGLSLFYYARTHCRQVRKESVPIFVSEKTFFTQFNFMNKLGSQEIDSVSYPIQTIEFDGTADFTGIFGLTGYFQGYFSNDNASIPIVAKMKVLIGSIRIELVKWNRPGWTPPKASS